jgi:hypothetical protein
MSTVALTIDYSNGAQKHFGNIPWTKNLTILDAIEAAARIPPGATIHFGSDRSGHTLGLRIDELPGADDDALRWSVWVNATPFAGGDRLGTDTSFNFRPDEREANLLKAGDHVVLKLSQKSKTQE